MFKKISELSTSEELDYLTAVARNKDIKAAKLSKLKHQTHIYALDKY